MEVITKISNDKSDREVSHWKRACHQSDVPENGGVCVRVGDLQIAVFNFKRKNSWYACQNLCPHQKEMVLSRGMLGDDGGKPKIACPLHKKTFCLQNGENLNGDLEPLTTYPVKIEHDIVYVGISE